MVHKSRCVGPIEPKLSRGSGILIRIPSGLSPSVMELHHINPLWELWTIPPVRNYTSPLESATKIQKTNDTTATTLAHHRADAL